MADDVWVITSRVVAVGVKKIHIKKCLRVIEGLRTVVEHKNTSHKEVEFDPIHPGSWKKGDLIGAGASGAVFMGLNEDGGSLIAVKEMKFSLEVDPTSVCPAMASSNFLFSIQLISPLIIIMLLTSHVSDNTRKHPGFRPCVFERETICDIAVDVVVL